MSDPTASTTGGFGSEFTELVVPTHLRRDPLGTEPTGRFVGPPDDPDSFELIGVGVRGGEGITSQARYAGGLKNPTTFAVKQLLPPSAYPRPWPTQDDWVRWVDQNRVLQQVRHQHVVAVFDLFRGAPPHRRGSVAPAVGQEFTVPYLVMEWIAGPSLTTLVESGGLGLDDALTCVAQLAEAVTALHSATRTAGNPLLHRDIKPDNCIVQPERGLVLVDLGSMRPVDDGHDPLGMHTRHYAAPEVLADPRAARDPASDLYALGAVAYFAVVGSQPPSPGDTGREKVLLQEIERVTAHHQLTDAPLLAKLLAQMLAPQPELRPSRPTVWARELRSAAATRPDISTAEKRTQPKASRRRFLLLGAALAAAATVAVERAISKPAATPTAPNLGSPSAKPSLSTTPTAAKFMPRWAWNRPVTVNNVVPPIPVTNGILVDSDGKATALELADGRLLWSKPGRLTGSAHNLAFLDADSGLQARDVSTGKYRWTGGADYAFGPTRATKTEVFATTSTGVALAFDPSGGKTLWRRPVHGGWSLSVPQLVGDLVIIADQSEHKNILGLHATTGKEAWSVSRDSTGGEHFAITSKWFAMEAFDGTSCIILSSRTGKLFDRILGGDSDTKDKDRPHLNWPPAGSSKLLFLSWATYVERYLVGGEGDALSGWFQPVAALTPPLLAGSRLCVGTKEGLTAIDAGTGEIAWNGVTEGSVSAPPVATSNSVYAGCTDGRLYCFDLRSGARRWSLATDSPISTSPLLSAEAVYVVSDAGTLYASRDL